MKKHKQFMMTMLFLVIAVSIAYAKTKPNVLWILTDDQRYDSIRAFNKMLHGREMSELGYVESPQTDRLAEMGTTFINTYCQAQGCAPSRASMHFGRYPFRSGVYEFEYHNNNAEHCKPTLPEQMADLGYQTVHVGKLGVRIKTVKNGKPLKHKIYQTDVDFKQMHKDGLTGWGKDWFYELDGVKLDQPIKEVRYFVTPDGTFEYASLELEKRFPKYAGSAEATMKKYDLLRHYNKKKPKRPDSGMILAGVSSQPAGKNRDGWYTSVLAEYLKNENKTFKVGSQTVKGVDPSKPLFCHLGFDFPHTPVLPPADYRARFQKHTYKVPTFDKKEFETMAKQLRRQVEAGYSDHFTDAQKQAMVQDYYAFCAYGDTLVGQAADAFIEYSEKHKQSWMIVYVCGDHGWKLNDHGAVSKFTPWDIDSHNPIIVVSSDKKAFPSGKVVKDFTEFVDIAPTCLAAGGANLKDARFDYLDGYDLEKVTSSEIPARDYVIGESHAVTGPRAFIRTKDFVFSMQTRPDKKRGKNMDWARNASYKELDPALYHMPSDPHEVNNLAFNPKYKQVAEAMQTKLLNIVLGDNRVEVNWGKKADGTEIYCSNFAPGADNKKLDLPVQLIPSLMPTSEDSAKEKPNIIIYFADDISAREIPVYGSSVWSGPMRETTSDPQYRAKTPVLDTLAEDGCWITTAWVACVCNPSRAMMMSGRYAHIHKWWNNKDKGLGPDENGKIGTWPVYQSSPLLIGHIAQKAGYGTYWAGKTQMAGSYEKHGFDEGCFTPGKLSNKDNPYTDFKHEYKKINGKRTLINVDTGKPADTYWQHGWYWYPHVKLMNHPTDPKRIVWWPNTPEAKKTFDLHTYGPDVELDFVFDFMDRKHQEGKPFFIYHTTHLGHDAFDWFDPDSKSSWPGTPVVKWDGNKYTRKDPHITGDNGVYDTHGTVTEPGIHSHVNYIDYQIWLYRQKLENMGIADNTIIIFCADNGTGGYGKNSGDRQKGCHIPMIIYAPDMKKHGRQDVLMSVADILPTIADLVGFEIPAEYEINGESLVPFLITDKKEHRQWLYTYRGPEQLIRGKKVMKDGRDKWWDVSKQPVDLIDFPQVKNWKAVSQAHRQERDSLLKILPKYDLYFDEFNAPGVPMQKNQKHPRYARKK